MIELRFASNNVEVPELEFSELVRRLRAVSGVGAAAANEVRQNRRFADLDQKSLALEVVTGWQHDVGAQALSDAVQQVKYELMRDLHVPPFDT